MALVLIVGCSFAIGGCGVINQQHKSPDTGKTEKKQYTKPKKKLPPLPPAGDPIAIFNYAKAVHHEYPLLWHELTPDALGAYDDLKIYAKDGEISPDEIEGAATPAYILHTGLEPAYEQSKAGFDLLQTDPGKSAAASINAIAKGQYGRAWSLLHPAHRLVAPLAKYDSCMKDSASSINLTGVVVTEVYDESFPVPGVKNLTDSKAVTVKLFTDQGNQTVTAHWYRNHGNWVSILSTDAYESFQQNECPT